MADLLGFVCLWTERLQFVRLLCNRWPLTTWPKFGGLKAVAVEPCMSATISTMCISLSDSDFPPSLQLDDADPR